MGNKKKKKINRINNKKKKRSTNIFQSIIYNDCTVVFTCVIYTHTHLQSLDIQNENCFSCVFIYKFSLFFNYLFIHLFIKNGLLVYLLIKKNHSYKYFINTK